MPVILSAAKNPRRHVPHRGRRLAALGVILGFFWGAAANASPAPSPPTPPLAWEPWFPREEIAPRFAREGRTLRIAATKPADFGAWRATFPNLAPGRAYRFSAAFRTADITDPRRAVIARLQFLDTFGRALPVSVRPPEYALDRPAADGSSVFETTVTAPAGAAALEIQLSLGFTTGSVAFDRVSLAEADPPRPRPVRVMTVHHRARGHKSAAENVAAYSKLIRDAAAQKPDIICLPEGMTVVGTGKKYFDVGEPVPGPTTESLGQLARELRTYIVAGLYERVPPALYNTAVLIDRDGRLAGTYRKVHLPREEWEAGITPGDSYPTFQTDFGKIALLVCWDVQFPEPWRAVALQGAELVLLPIWGGSETLFRARAIENHVYAVASSYDMRSLIVAPNGEILADAQTHGPVATAEIDLARKIYQPWLGDMSTRTWKERRPDLATPLTR